MHIFRDKLKGLAELFSGRRQVLPERDAIEAFAQCWARMRLPEENQHLARWELALLKASARQLGGLAPAFASIGQIGMEPAIRPGAVHVQVFRNAWTRVQDPSWRCSMRCDEIGRLHALARPLGGLAHAFAAIGEGTLAGRAKARLTEMSPR